MRPYYSKNGVVLYNEKCEDILSLLGRFDATVSDPPYGIGEAAGKNKSRGNLAESRDYGNLDWDCEPPTPEVLQLCINASRQSILFGGNFFHLPPASCWLVWWKMNGTNDFADCELAWTNLPGAVRMLQFRWNGFIRDCKDERVHPTQKPVDVMRWCLSWLDNKTKTVIDPFCGSCSTAIACMRAGLEFVGIESHEPYLEAGVKRIEREFNRAPLFEQSQKQQEMF